MDLDFSGPYGVYHSEYDNFEWMSKFGDPDFSYHITMASILGLCAIRLSEHKIIPFTYTPYSNSLFEYMEDFSVALALSQFNQSVSIKPLWDTLNEYKNASATFDAIVSRHLIEPQGYSPDYLNSIMLKSESCFLDPKGTPGRPWYKHVVFSPDEWSGYRAKLFSSLHESLSGTLDQVNSAIKNTVQVLQNAVSCLQI
jgi:N-acetylated-alpha-linked acidic dipeptidase